MSAITELAPAVAKPATSLESRANVYRERAGAIEIANDDEYEAAAKFLKEVKSLDKEVETFFKPHVAAAHKAHKQLKEAENAVRDPLKKALDIVGRKAGMYQAELERQRQLEREMLLAEQKRAMDEAAIQLAEGLAENGQIEAAEGVLNQAAKLQPEVNCESIAPKVRGTAVLETWKFEIVDAAAIPREYLCPDEAKIGAMVRTCKGGTNIPGVRAFSETKVSARV